MKPETLAGLERITRDFEQFASVVRQETAATVALEDHVALIKHFADLRVIADRAKTIREALYDIEDHLSRTDIPDLFAKQKIKGQAKRKIYTRGSVAESGLAEFGSSVPGDKRSAPVASLTYTWLFALPQYPEFSPVAVINTRSSLKAGRQLYNKIELRPAQPFAQLYTMFKTDEGTSDEPFNGYGYVGAGYVSDEEMYNQLKELHERFSSEDTQWRVNEETDDAPSDGGGAPTGERPSGETATKF